jgi:hypothetical protein
MTPTLLLVTGYLLGALSALWLLDHLLGGSVLGKGRA